MSFKVFIRTRLVHPFLGAVAPRRVSFEVKLRVLRLLAPKGRKHVSPGQRPGLENAPIRDSPLKGKTTDCHAPWFCHFRATMPQANRIPGRCPGLSCFGPFGAEEKSQLQNAQASGSLASARVTKSVVAYT
jgi:hypothetical protein